MLRLKSMATAALNHRGLRRYSANLAWLFSEHFLRILSGIFVGVWIARYLGPEAYGVLSYTLAFCAIFGIIAKLGLENILIRELVNTPEEAESYMASAFWLRLAISALMIIVILTAATLAGHGGRQLLYILIIASGLLFNSTEIISYFFHARVLAKFVSICRIIQLVLSIVLRVALILAGADLLAFVAVILLEEMLMAGFLYVAYRGHLRRPPALRFCLDKARYLLGQSWPLILSSFAVMIYMRIDQVMIRAMLDERQVGLYTAGIKIPEALYFIPMLLTGSLFPAILNARKISAKLYHGRIQNLLLLGIWGTVLLALPLSIGAGPIIGLLFGEAYAAASPVLVIYAWNLVFLAMGVTAGKWLYAERLQTLHLLKTLGGLGANVALNLLLIPRHGIAGAAAASFVSQLIAYFFVFALFRRTRLIFRMQLNALLPPLLLLDRRPAAATPPA
jgi:O-antigen/teichoic acid export membrane protein